MSDRRVEILNSEYNKWVAEKRIGAIYPPNFPESYKDAAINAMDENGKQMCLALLEYIASNLVSSTMYNDHTPMFLFKGQWITKEQLFENFL